MENVVNKARKCVEDGVQGREVARKGLFSSIIGMFRRRKTYVGAACTAVAVLLAYRKVRSVLAKISVEARLASARSLEKGDGVGESLIPGSEIYPVEAARMPNCMRAVIVEDPAVPGTFLRAGNCIRIGDFLVLPLHVVARSNVFYVVTSGCESHIELKSADVKELAVDVGFLPLEPSYFSRIGMGAVKPGFLSQQIVVNAGSFVASGEPPADAYTSTGDLRKDSAFGCIQYYGSTRPGFSGGLYYYGRQAFAMHLRRGPPGSGYNIGVAIPYLEALLEIKRGTNETTAEWLIKLAARHDPELSYIEEDEDYYLFTYRGKYIPVGREEYDQLYEDHEETGQFEYKPGYRNVDVSAGDFDRPDRSKRGYRNQHVSDEEDDDDDSGDEAASDIVVSKPGYKEDQLKADTSFLVDVAVAHPEDTANTLISETVRSIPIQPKDCTHTLDRPRLMNDDVKLRLQAKAEALTQQKVFEEMYDELKQQQERCVNRFRACGEDWDKHAKVRVELDRIMEEMIALKPLLKNANVIVSQTSAQTAEEKKLAVALKKKRKQARKAAETAQKQGQLQAAEVVGEREDGLEGAMRDPSTKFADAEKAGSASKEADSGAKQATDKKSPPPKSTGQSSKPVDQNSKVSADPTTPTTAGPPTGSKHSSKDSATVHQCTSKPKPSSKSQAKVSSAAS